MPTPRHATLLLMCVYKAYTENLIHNALHFERQMVIITLYNNIIYNTVNVRKCSVVSVGYSMSLLLYYLCIIFKVESQFKPC